MTAYARLFARGWLIVSLTSANVRQINGGHYLGAFAVGCAISGVWWFNSRNAAHTDSPLAWAAYSLGAGIGTVTGMYLAGLMG